jgi:hypothetical protein
VLFFGGFGGNTSFSSEPEFDLRLSEVNNFLFEISMSKESFVLSVPLRDNGRSIQSRKPENHFQLPVT